MKVAILASGGKDSTYASWWAGLQGWDVVSMVTVLVRGEDSMMFQLPNTSLAGLQAYSIGIPWLPILSEGNEEEEIEDLDLNTKQKNSNTACTVLLKIEAKTTVSEPARPHQRKTLHFSKAHQHTFAQFSCILLIQSTLSLE